MWFLGDPFFLWSLFGCPSPREQMLSAFRKSNAIPCSIHSHPEPDSGIDLLFKGGGNKKEILFSFDIKAWVCMFCSPFLMGILLLVTQNARLYACLLSWPLIVATRSHKRKCRRASAAEENGSKIDELCTQATIKRFV